MGEFPTIAVVGCGTIGFCQLVEWILRINGFIG